MSHLETDSEDELPTGWEERSTLDGKVYYANHESKETQWTHPSTGLRKKIIGDLPYGWEQTTTDEGIVVYVDHVNKKTTYTDPRLAFAIEDGNDKNSLRQKFDASSTALQILHGQDLHGKVVIVTGANCGIGFETAKSLAFHGAHVIFACRQIEKANEAIEKIKLLRSNLSMEGMELNLCSLNSVRNFANEFKLKHQKLNILILNAGIFGNSFAKTEDGFEETFQVNHLAQFYVTLLLESILISSAPSRIVVVSSESHRFNSLNLETLTEEKLSPPTSSTYSSMMAYNNSKVCNILFSKALDARLKDKSVRSFSLHPGNMVSTNISRSWWLYRIFFALVRPFTKSLQQACATTVYCACSADLDFFGGLYFNNCCQCTVGKIAEDSKAADALWDISKSMIQMTLGENSIPNLQ